MASTKEKITATALALFAQRGYDGVSVRDICKQVGDQGELPVLPLPQQAGHPHHPALPL